MTGDWRPADPTEIGRIWPAVRTAVVARSSDEFQAFYEQAPWRVRVSDRGDVLVLKQWRAALDILAIKAAVAPNIRIPALIREAFAVARAQGFDQVVSPLVPHGALGPYLASGMSQIQCLVALNAPPAVVGSSLPPARLTVRAAQPQDIDALLEIDAQCFDSFWRYGSQELTDVLRHEHVAVVYEGHKVLGYATASIVAATCTLGRLGVDPRMRGLGVGTTLVREVARWAQRERSLSLSLCTQADNTVARRFYASLGLAEMSELYALAAARVSEVEKAPR